MRFQKVYLEITNCCNLNCTFCPGTVREPKFLTYEEFDLLTDRLMGWTRFLYFHLMGEPLLHPLLEDFLRLAGKKGYRVIITTNGTLIDEKIINMLLSCDALHKVNISLQSFEANPERSALSSYIERCCIFAKSAQSSGIITVFRLWNEGGQNSRNSEIIEQLRHNFDNTWKESPRNTVISDRIFLEHASKFDWPDESAPDYGATGFCYGLRDQIGVLSDGTVVPCCLDRDAKLALGNLFDEPLDRILECESANRIYNGFSGRKAVAEFCRHCGYARRFSQ